MKYSNNIKKYLFPIYIGTLISFLTTLFYFEYVEDEHDFAILNKGKRDKDNKLIIMADDPRFDPNYGRTGMTIIGVVNLLFTLINIYVVARKTYETKATYWASQWGPIDATFCLFNLIIVILILNFDKSEFLRYLEAIASILMAQKSLYFLEMNSKLAPLIFIFYKVLSDIYYFVWIIAILFLAFASSFYLLGRNQL